MDPSSMDGAYGKSRGELLAWLNATLPVDLQQHTGDIAKIEQCGSGIPYVFLLPRLFPNSASAQAAPGKVKFPARQEYEAASNLKLVQEVFSKNQISRNMDIDKMSKRNFQANLEFLQWFKRLCDNHSVGGGGNDDADVQQHHQPAPLSHQQQPSGVGSGVVSGSSSSASGRPTVMVRRLGGGGVSPSTSSPGSRKPSTGAGSTASAGGANGAGAVRSLFSVAPASSSRLAGSTAAAASGAPPSANGFARPLSAASSTREPSSSSSSFTRGTVSRGGAPAAAVGGVVRSIISPTRRSKSPIGPALSTSSGRSTSATRSLTPSSTTRPVYGAPSGASRGFTPPPGTTAATSGRASVGSMDPVGYVELERRYYYDKLRRIEELVRLPATEGNELALVVQKLLYAAH
ncbi:Hypothetical protein, putative [Bodo saltans]|uniref:Calponin-homology (CH) domain-containing protein n=1 Tax=Bodo saltans TaxID=75058 RepID=A0A0S4JDF8_BODSA|nr:Hypothetical protein, putative [Bodo saltans]|eukprot:CUG89418.1 Hypothetical protein, putative [Bodo saltans]